MDDITWAQKQEAIVKARRRVLAAMETGNEPVARTLYVEIREYDVTAALRLRSDVLGAYGTDIAV